MILLSFQVSGRWLENIFQPPVVASVCYIRTCTSNSTSLLHLSMEFFSNATRQAMLILLYGLPSAHVVETDVHGNLIYGIGKKNNNFSLHLVLCSCWHWWWDQYQCWETWCLRSILSFSSSMTASIWWGKQVHSLTFIAWEALEKNSALTLEKNVCFDYSFGTHSSISLLTYSRSSNLYVLESGQSLASSCS